MAASRSEEGRGWFCWILFLSLTVRSWTSRGNWADVEERRIDRIKATLPDAELALGAVVGFRVEGGVGGESERAVHQQHVCIVGRKQSKLHCCT